MRETDPDSRTTRPTTDGGSERGADGGGGSGAEGDAGDGGSDDGPDVRALAADGVVVVDGEVVLMERDHPPDEGSWVLPGGVVERGETARAACAREVEEELGVVVEPLTFVGLYDGPDRDPRGNVSAAYLCVPATDDEPRAGEEATRVKHFPPEELPEMGFDHADIVSGAFGRETRR